MRGIPAAAVENSDAGRVFRRKAQDLAKIPVKRHQNTSRGAASLIKRDVVGAAHLLLHDRGDLMTRRLKQVPAEITKTLVDLELHSPAVPGTGITRSRANSAP